MKDICEVISPDKKYYIYGTATFGKYCCDKITEKFGDDIICGFIETNPKVEKIHNKKVFSPNEVENNELVIITGFAAVEAMKNTLLKLGFKNENIII